MMHGIRSAYGSSNDLNAISFAAINTIGNMGVTIFILISGYFGIKMRLSKLFKLWSIVLFYSLLIFLYNTFINQPIENFALNKELIKDAYRALTPITSNTWWFITSYTILFMLSPLLNKAVKSMSKFQMQYLLVILLIFYSISPTILMHSLSNTPNGKCTENMILAYLIGRYIAIYGVPSSIKNKYIVILVSCFCLIFSINYFVFDPLFMAKDHNMFIILGSVCVFTMFSNINITNTNISKSIAWIATFAFPIYILNIFLIDNLEFQYASLNTSSAYLAYYLVAQCEIIAISILAESVRRLLLEKPVSYIENIIDRKTTFLSDKLN
jgi:surface polysaccharide O-acyltransferase-like enzyme